MNPPICRQPLVQTACQSRAAANLLKVKGEGAGHKPADCPHVGSAHGDHALLVCRCALARSGSQYLQQLVSSSVWPPCCPYGRAGCDMAAITTNDSIASSSPIASTQDVRAAFREYTKELTWLAGFLTDDETMAPACVAEVYEVTNSNDDEIRYVCVEAWPREATLLSALELKWARIAELSSVYAREDETGQQHLPLSEEKIELVVRESDVIRRRLDSLCRFVLILCGVERRSAGEAAVLLGISKHVVEVAYSRVLEVLEVTYCEEFLESYGCVRV